MISASNLSGQVLFFSILKNVSLVRCMLRGKWAMGDYDLVSGKEDLLKKGFEWILKCICLGTICTSSRNSRPRFFKIGTKIAIGNIMDNLVCLNNPFHNIISPQTLLLGPKRKLLFSIHYNIIRVNLCRKIQPTCDILDNLTMCFFLIWYVVLWMQTTGHNRRICSNIIKPVVIFEQQNGLNRQV